VAALITYLAVTFGVGFAAFALAAVVGNSIADED
jgi:hypothetical protein